VTTERFSNLQKLQVQTCSPRYQANFTTVTKMHPAYRPGQGPAFLDSCHLPPS
jgi:hypothetical protein